MNRSILMVVFATDLVDKGLFSRFYRLSGLKTPVLTVFCAENALFRHFVHAEPGRKRMNVELRRQPARQVLTHPHPDSQTREQSVLTDGNADSLGAFFLPEG